MKRTIIMVSGWAHPARTLRPLADRFLNDCEVILLSSMELTEYAGSLARLIRERSTPPLVMGWSMGGLLALEAATRLKAPIAGLVLLNSTACFCSTDEYPHGTPPRQVRALSIAIRKNALAALSQFIQEAEAPSRLSPQGVQTRTAQALEFGSEQLCRDLQYLAETDLRTEAAGFEAPTLLLHGREDRVIPWQAGEYLRERLPQSRLRVLDAEGHALPLRRPDRVLDETRAFFQEIFS